MEEFVERFFRPLVNGYWNRYRRMFPSVEEDPAKAEAVVQCFIKFDNFDPAKGNSYSYFTQVISRVFFQDEGKAQQYASRYINESAMDKQDDL